MKRFLLSITLYMLAFAGIQAEEVTGNAATTFGSATTNVTEFIVDPVTLTFSKADGSTAPAYNKSGDCRIYAKNTITATCSTGNLTKIVFTVSAQGKKRLTDLTPSTGTVTIADDHSTITWEGNATEIVMTVGEKAVYGTDGNTKAGQICFTDFTATYSTDGGTVTPTPDPEEPDGGEGEGGGSNGGTTEEGVYINESFKSDFGAFTTVETVGDYPWIIDYSTAKATSYVDGKNEAATSWLISTPVDFTNETEAYVAFEYIIRYSESGKVAANHQLLISADYTGDATKATWVDLPYGAVEGSDWATFYKANVAIPAEFLGKSGIVFALRYTATTKASTWEVKNFKVAHGTADAPEEPEVPTVVKEYTVAEAIAAYVDGKQIPAIITGYIVGTIDGQAYTDGCRFSGTAESKTNLLIADNVDETDPAKCMPVQLPSGAVRNALNLVDNPGNYKKEVKLTGSLEKYFSVPGLKAVTEYEIEGATPEEPEVPTEAKEYTVNKALAAYVDGKQIPAIVTGYIVGAMNSSGYVPEFGATTISTNLLLSDDPEEDAIENCIIVQLPSGDIRTALNLVDHPDYFQKKIKITGSIETYFQQAGLKNPTAYEFTDGTGIEDVILGETAAKVIFDITGRRIDQITNPGIYIVNGKKVLVK